MKLSLLVSSKVLLTCCNFLLLGCGSVLITSGFLLLCDSASVLLSRLLVPGPDGMTENLSQPLFYYFALGIIGLGLILCLAGVMGCWAACIDNYCMLTMYFLFVMIVLMGECGMYAVVSIWPHCLGLTVASVELTHSLQREYGVSGHEQFTAAVDLAQTSFSCCGISSSVEYDTSLWKLQAVGHPSMVVPLSCCRLSNVKEPKAYLDPVPLNKTLCEAVDFERQQGFRHTDGCMPQLEQWYHEQYILFIAIGLVIVLIEFAVLLSTILSCIKIYKHRYFDNIEDGDNDHKVTTNKSCPELNSNQSNEKTFQRIPFSYSNETYTMSNSFRQNYKLADKA